MAAHLQEEKNATRYDNLNSNAQKWYDRFIKYLCTKETKTNMVIIVPHHRLNFVETFSNCFNEQKAFYAWLKDNEYSTTEGTEIGLLKIGTALNTVRRPMWGVKSNLNYFIRKLKQELEFINEMLLLRTSVSDREATYMIEQLLNNFTKVEQSQGELRENCLTLQAMYPGILIESEEFQKLRNKARPFYEQLFSSTSPRSDKVKICESRIDQLLKSINICLGHMENFRKNVLTPCQDDASAAAVEAFTAAQKAEAIEFISNVATTRLLAEDYI